MTPQEIITTARYIMNDADDPYRQSDTELLGYVNEAIQSAAVIRPDLFSTVGDFTCEAGQCEQTANFLDASEVVEVLSIHGGRALTPFDINAMNLFRPTWRTDTAGEAIQWSKLQGDPLRFFVYPKAPIGQVIDVRYLRTPGTYALDQDIADLPAKYQPALVSYVVARTESKDSEHVLSQRSQAHYQEFAAQLKG